MLKRNKGVSIKQVADFLDKKLSVAEIKDYALNGLQVTSERLVKRLGIAVDGALAIFKAAKQQEVDLLIVHHGIFWGQEQAIIGPHYQRLKILLEAGIGLYAVHLPLDRHPQLGNNILLAKRLKLQKIRPFGVYNSITIGFGGELNNSLSFKSLANKVAKSLGNLSQVFTLGKNRVRRIAIVSGAGGELIYEAKEAGYDTFITGEISHAQFHLAKELEINIIAAGHYATETLGVKALGSLVAKKFKLENIFLDYPTNL